MIHEMFPYLTVSDGQRAIDFYTAAFGATEKFRLQEDSGRVAHAELDLDGKTLMLAEEFPELGLRSASTIGATAVTIHLHVDDADALIRRAVEHGATVEREPRDQFYGERSGSLFDPFGHRWLIGHDIEAVTPDEMQRRMSTLEQG